MFFNLFEPLPIGIPVSGWKSEPWFYLLPDPSSNAPFSLTRLSKKLKSPCALRPVGVGFAAGQLSERFRRRWVNRPDESGLKDKHLPLLTVFKNDWRRLILRRLKREFWPAANRISTGRLNDSTWALWITAFFNSSSLTNGLTKSMDYRSQIRLMRVFWKIYGSIDLIIFFSNSVMIHLY